MNIYYFKILGNYQHFIRNILEIYIKMSSNQGILLLRKQLRGYFI